MKLVLSRVQAQDFDQITHLIFSSFNHSHEAQTFIGRNETQGKAFAKRFMLMGFNTNPAGVFMKVTDEDSEVDVDIIEPLHAENDDDEASGAKETKKKEPKREKKIVGISNWKINPTFVAKANQPDPKNDGRLSNDKLEEIESSLGSDRATIFGTYAERMSAMRIFLDFHTTLDKAISEAHVYCFMVVTHPDYARKGVGRMMLQWGNEVADKFMVACWTQCVAGVGEGVFGRMAYEVIEGEAISGLKGVSD